MFKQCWAWKKLATDNFDQKSAKSSWLCPFKRIRKIITKGEMSWCMMKFSQLIPKEMCGEQWGEYACWYCGLEG